MPKLVKSDVLVLRRFRHGDTSLIVHGFTREFGRIPFIAKGARSGGKKPPVPLIPVVVLEFVWSPSTRSELQLLREWSLVDGLGAVHRDYVKLAWAQAGIEVLQRTLTGEEEHSDLFDLTVRYLQNLGEINERYENLFILFRLIALRELGYQVSSDAPDDPHEPLVYVPGRGLLPRSRVEKNYADSGIRLQPGTWKLLQMLTKHGFAGASRVKLTKDAKLEIERMLGAAFRNAFDKWGKLESLKLLEPLESMARTATRKP